MPTETPTPVPWPTPTLMPLPNTTPAIDLEFSGDNSFFVTFIDSGIANWNNANRDGAIDAMMTLLIIVIVLFGTISILRRMREL